MKKLKSLFYFASCLSYISVSFATSVMKKELKFRVCLKTTPFPYHQPRGYYLLQSTLRASNLEAVMPEGYYLFYMPYVNKKTGNIFQKSILFPEFYGEVPLKEYKPAEDELDRDFVLDRNLVIPKSQLFDLNEAIERKNYNFLELNKNIYKGTKSEEYILQSLGKGNSVLYYSTRKQKVVFRSLKDFINNKPQTNNQWIKPLPLTWADIARMSVTGAGILGYKNLSRKKSNKKKKPRFRLRTCLKSLKCCYS